jgi:hypothetical protein
MWGNTNKGKLPLVDTNQAQYILLKHIFKNKEVMKHKYKVYDLPLVELQMMKP